MDSNLKNDEGNNLDDDKIKQLKKDTQVKNYNKDSIVFNCLNIRKSNIINYSKITNELNKIIDETKKEKSQLNNNLTLNILSNINKNKKRNSFQLNNYFNETTIVTDIFKIPPEKRTFDDLLTIREYLLKTKLYSYFKSEDILEEAIQKLITMCSIEFEYINYNKNDTIYKSGDIPKNFYLILKGKINVLRPAQKKEVFSGLQYFFYLMDLKNKNELFLMNLSIKENQKVYPILEKDINLIPYIYIQYNLNLILEDFEVNFIDAVQICNLTLESLGLNKDIEITKDYLSKNKKLILSHMPNISNKMYSKYIFLFDDIYKKEIQYFYYKIFDILEPGDFFGDFDLDSNIKRKDTILIKEDSDLAYFNYKLYGRHIFNEKQVILDKEINYLHSNFFFSKIQITNFVKNYFDYFIMVKYKKNQVLFKENYPLEYIYFIKSGEVQLYSKKSPIEIQELLNDLKKRTNNNKCFEEYQYREIKSNIFDLKDDLIIKSLNKILSLKNNEILGIESFYYGYNYLYTAITSQNTHIYKIEKMNLMEILKNESLCYNYLDKKVSDTINIFYNRLFLINNTLITIADKKENFNQKIILEKNYHSPKEKDNNKVKFKYHYIFDLIKYEKLKQKKSKLPFIPKNKSVIFKDILNNDIKKYNFYESDTYLPNNSNRHIFEDSLLIQIKKDINKYNEKKKLIKNNILISNISEKNENDNKKIYKKYSTIDNFSFQFTPNKKLETLKKISSSEEKRNNFFKKRIKKNELSKSSSLKFDNKQLKKCFNNITQDKQNENDNLKSTIDSYIPKSIKNQFLHQKYKIDFTKKKLKSYKELKQKLSDQVKFKLE